MPCSIPASSAACPTPTRSARIVDAEIDAAADYQEALDRARVVGSEQAFLIGVRVLSGTITAAQAGGAYAPLAEHLIARPAGARSRARLVARSTAASPAARRASSPWASSAAAR